MKYTYALIDFFTILFPFLLSFHRQSNFYQSWRSFFPALFITGIIFVLWDVYFTSIGVWGFNAKYVTGLYIGNLPIEEILFFVCIPYACVFTFTRFYNNVKINFTQRRERIIFGLLIIVFAGIAIIYHDRKYTCATFIVLIITHLLATYVLKVKWMIKFYVIYAFLLIPFFIVNGLLTGTGLSEPVVWYNNRETIGLRLLTIPVEDFFYGINLVLINLLFYFKFAGGLFHNSHHGVPGE